VLEALQYKRGGYFVDLACNDPLQFSNSYALEKFYNWSGLCIDGNPKYAPLYPGTRKCEFVLAIVDRVSRRNVEFRTDNDGLGGIVDADVDNNPEFRGDEILFARATGGIHIGVTVSLHVLLMHHRAPRIIDYLSLDIEGAEERALTRNVLENYVFRTITIEQPTPALNQLLAEFGYVYARSVPTVGAPDESFYVHKSVPRDHLLLEPFIQVTTSKGW